MKGLSGKSVPTGLPCVLWPCLGVQLGPGGLCLGPPRGHLLGTPPAWRCQLCLVAPRGAPAEPLSKSPEVGAAGRGSLLPPLLSQPSQEGQWFNQASPGLRFIPGPLKRVASSD